jgi:tRNA-dihydrouridine synthase C
MPAQAQPTQTSPTSVPETHAILLAPMEGVLDHSLRDVLTRFGGIDRCVSEFIRVTDQLLPARVYKRLMPELDHGSRTPAGVPVRAQLLGSDPACLADNAALLATLGPAGIDLNFGCPAKTVNRHRGGAVLLDEPELVHRIVLAVRRAVPAAMPVSAKMRLGYLDTHRAVDCALAIASAGAAEVVVHARTRAQGYKPPAYWHHINRIRQALAIPVVANGEIWTVQDAAQCKAESGCSALMLGRGLVSNPGLALALKGQPAPDWPTVLQAVRLYASLIAKRVEPKHQSGRVKQWLNMLRRHYPQAQALYEATRATSDLALFKAALFGPSPRSQAGPMAWGPAVAAGGNVVQLGCV